MWIFEWEFKVIKPIPDVILISLHQVQPFGYFLWPSLKITALPVSMLAWEPVRLDF